MFRVIFHLDMDAFYASVEQRDHSELRGQPVIVGAPPTQRGVVCAASYEARRFGVRSAMPSATAGRLCPSGIFVRPRMEQYREESRHIMQIVSQTGVVVETMSIDEAYLDVSTISQAEDTDHRQRNERPCDFHLLFCQSGRPGNACSSPSSNALSSDRSIVATQPFFRSTRVTHSSESNSSASISSENLTGFIKFLVIGCWS